MTTSQVDKNSILLKCHRCKLEESGGDVQGLFTAKEQSVYLYLRVCKQIYIAITIQSIIHVKINKYII